MQQTTSKRFSDGNDNDGAPAHRRVVWKQPPSAKVLGGGAKMLSSSIFPASALASWEWHNNFAQMNNELQRKREHIVDAFNKCSNWEQVQTCHHVARQHVVGTPRCLPDFVVL